MNSPLSASNTNCNLSKKQPCFEPVMEKQTTKYSNHQNIKFYITHIPHLEKRKGNGRRLGKEYSMSF